MTYWMKRLGMAGILAASMPALCADDLAALSDEFDDSGTLKNWKRVFQQEQWPHDQLELWDVNQTEPGWMVMVPFTSSWYKDYRGVLAFKEVEGDFVVTTRMKVTGRSGRGAPHSQFSLAGIMIRVPRQITPQTWTPGGENYIFVSMGAANKPGTYQFEVKTTLNSDSQLEISNDGASQAKIRVARIGEHLILMRRLGGGPWTVKRRYRRSDFPKTLQVGLTCYTDWPNVEKLAPFDHNRQLIQGGSPDLAAGFDYVRYARPSVSKAMASRNLSDPGSVSDAELLEWLGN